MVFFLKTNSLRLLLKYVNNKLLYIQFKCFELFIFNLLYYIFCSFCYFDGYIFHKYTAANIRLNYAINEHRKR